MLTNAIVYTIVSGINTTANIIIIWYFIATLIAFKELDFSNIREIHYVILAICIAIILIFPADDLLRLMFELPPEIKQSIICH